MNNDNQLFLFMWMTIEWLRLVVMCIYLRISDRYSF